MDMKFIRLCILLVIASLASACGGEDPIGKLVFADSGKSFNLISGLSKGASVVCDGVGYSAIFDDVNLTAVITISNFRLDSGDEPVTFTFSNVDWVFGTASHVSQRVIQASRLVPDDDFGTAHVFTDFIMVYSQANEFDKFGSDGFYVSYTVDGSYTVMAYPEQMLCQGTTRVVDLATGRDAISYKTKYHLTLSAGHECCADMNITELPMLQGVSSMSLSSVDVTLTRAGYDMLSASSTRFIAHGQADAGLESLVASADMLGELNIEMRFIIGGTPYKLEAYLTPNLSPAR